MEIEDHILYSCVPYRYKTNILGLSDYYSIVDHFDQFHSNEISSGSSEEDESDIEDENDVEDEEGDKELEEYLENHTFKICRICQTSYSFRHTDLWNHIISNHKYYYGWLEIYKCKICNKEFPYKKLLEDHFTSVHGINEHKSNNYFKITIRKCGLCKKDFTSSKLLEDHFTNSYKLKKVDIENYRKIVIDYYQAVCLPVSILKEKNLKEEKEDLKTPKKENNIKDLTTPNKTIVNKKESNGTVTEVTKKITTDTIIPSSNDETIENSAVFEAKLEEKSILINKTITIKNTSEDKNMSDHQNTRDLDTEIEKENTSQEADNIIAKDISIECHICKKKIANKNSAVEHRKLFHQNIKTLDNYNHASANIDVEEVKLTKDIMKIMTLNAILSTSKEDMIQDPTIVKSTLQTNNSEDQKIIINHELKEGKEGIKILNETIESSADIKAKKCHLCDTNLTNILSLDKHMKSIHKVENVIAKDTSTNEKVSCNECNISPPEKGSLKTHKECTRVTKTITHPKIDLLTNHVEKINFKFSEIQETEKDINSSKEVNSNISQSKVLIGKNIVQKTATNKTEIFKADISEDNADNTDSTENIKLKDRKDKITDDERHDTTMITHYCKAKVKDAKALLYHVKKHHETIENHHCKAIFKDKASFIDHLEKKHKSFQKQGTHKDLTRAEEDWIESIRTMEEDRFDIPAECSEIIGNYCQSCDETYLRKSNFLAHIQENHNDRGVDEEKIIDRISKWKRKNLNHRTEIADLLHCVIYMAYKSVERKKIIDKIPQLQNELISPQFEPSDSKSETKEAFENQSQILEEKIIHKVLQSEKEMASSRSELSGLKSEIKEVIISPKSMETSLADTLNKNEKNPSEKRVNVKETNTAMGENTSQNTTEQSEQTSGPLCTELKEVTNNASSRSELSGLKSEIKEVIISPKSMETSLADKLNKSEKNPSEKRVNVKETNIIMRENTSQNTTKQSEQTSGSLCTELKEVTINVQELDISQKNNLAENSANPSTILELAKVQEKCISASLVNTISILNLKETQENLKTENATNFELIKKSQEEINLRMATFIKQNCKCRLNGNSPGETSSGKQIYANNTLREITTEENISVNTAEIEQSNHGTKTNIKVEVETTSPEKISSDK